MTNNVYHAIHQWWINNVGEYLTRTEIENMSKDEQLNKFLEWEGIIGYNEDIKSIFEEPKTNYNAYASRFVNYCIKNNLCTCADIKQYNKMQELWETSVEIKSLASMVYICSETEKSISEIYKDLIELMEVNL